MPQVAPDSASELLERRADIDASFGGDSVEAIYASLAARGGEWAEATLAQLRT